MDRNNKVVFGAVALFGNFILAFILFYLLYNITPAKADGVYISGYGGANYTTGFGGSGGGGDYKFSASPDTGYVIGGTLGTNVNAIPGLRIEGDLSYRRNNIQGAWTYFVPDGPCCVEALAKVEEETPGEWVPDMPFQGSDSTVAFLANAAYGFNLGPVHPYALGGVGYARRSLVLTSITHPNLDTTEEGFAWQAGGGVSYEIAKGVQLSVDYRYFQGPSITRTVDLWETPVTFNSDGVNQSVTSTLTFALN